MKHRDKTYGVRYASMMCRLPPNGNAVYDITMIGGRLDRKILPKHVVFGFKLYIEHPNLFESLHPDHPYSQILMMIKRENIDAKTC